MDPAPASPAPPNGSGALRDKRYVMTALMLVMALASLEMTVTSTAMPTIIADLHGLEHYAWVASVYLLASTVTMPLYGRLADKLGRKRVIIAAIGLFTAGSCLAAAAQSMMQLVVFRGIQGLGAGGIMPVVLTILADVLTLEQRTRMQGLFSAVWGLAGLSGPALGAFLVHTLGWRSIFFVNLPFGLLGLGVLAWKYHEHEKPHDADLDLPGVLSLGLAATALLALLSHLGPQGWSAPTTAALLVTSIAAAAFFVRHELRAEHPIMPPKLMASRTVGAPIAAAGLVGGVFLCVDTYVPLYVQGGRGGTAAAAAAALTPVVVTWAVSNVLAAPLLLRWGFRKTALASSVVLLLGFAGLFLCALFRAPHWLLTVVLAVCGFGLGPCSMAYLLAAQDATPYHQRGSVTSTVAFFRTIGGALGVGALGALLNFLIRPMLRRMESEGIAPGVAFGRERGVSVPEHIATWAHAQIEQATIWIFLAMALMAAAAMAVTTLMVPRKAGHKVTATEAIEAMGA